MSKYWAFFKISLKKSLEYRMRLFIWFFWDIGPALIMMFFWLAVFKTRNNVASYDFSSMMIYYLALMFARNLILTHPDEPLQQEIFSGQFNNYLSQPADLISLKFFYELAYKFLKLIYLIPVLLICYFIFFQNQSVSFQPALINVLFFLLSCAVSFCLYYLIKILVGILAFWFTDIEWTISFEELVFWFFGGLLLPLDLLPKGMQKIADLLPFKYIFYFPSQILLGKLDLKQIIFSFLIQLGFLTLFLLLVRKAYQAGLKIYAAFGG